MSKHQRIYDPAVGDGRFQLEMIGLRWALVGFYALFTYIGIIDVDPAWFALSEGFLIGYHLYYTAYTWYELARAPLPPGVAYATPFLDTLAVSLALIAIGNALHPIWGVYFFIIVGIAFFYYPIMRVYVFWLIANYAAVGVGLEARGIEPPVAHMVVGCVILLAGMYNVGAYTSGERRLRGRISEVARTDPLTNLLIRRGLEERLASCLEEAAEERRPLAALMIDVDRFKRYNDQYGHLVADRMLEQLAKVLTAAAPEADLLARYGGDEFVVIIPNVKRAEVREMAERLCDQVARLGLCTVSIGVSVWDGDSHSVKELLDSADAALLGAKQDGRNRVRLSGDGVRRAA